jgi:hypothetical protein
LLIAAFNKVALSLAVTHWPIRCPFPAAAGKGGLSEGFPAHVVKGGEILSRGVWGGEAVLNTLFRTHPFHNIQGKENSLNGGMRGSTVDQKNLPLKGMGRRVSQAEVLTRTQS